MAGNVDIDRNKYHSVLRLDTYNAVCIHSTMLMLLFYDMLACVASILTSSSCVLDYTQMSAKSL